MPQRAYLILLLALLVCSCGEETLAPVVPRTVAPTDDVWMLTVQIPEGLDEAAREAKYDTALAQVLAADKIGVVSGGGVQTADNGRPLSCTIDLDVTDLTSALALVTAELRRLEAPKGSMIQLLDPQGDSVPVWR